MGIAAYNRGSRVIAREEAPAAAARADRQAHKDEVSKLRARVAQLEKELSRARRCIAAGRYAHEARMSEARAEQRAAAFAIETLCRIAF